MNDQFHLTSLTKHKLLLEGANQLEKCKFYKKNYNN